ncbi:MAG: FAD-dependent oxidoreductase [Comamonadaceae bacterium]|nr:MAG: FAD-dependent oxidoreductase [Comamonadaceae bacterium]
MPEAWAHLPQWRVFDTDFGTGLHFLTLWRAWRADPQRPRLLHVVAITPEATSTHTLASPELAADLAAQWHGLLPGIHRLSFDNGRVLLTLCIGALEPMLRAQRFEADAIVFSGPAEAVKPAARFARRGTELVARSDTPAVRDALAQNGFQIEPSADAGELRAVFAPAWTVRRRGPPPERLEAPGRCAVIGAGLAGAAVANSLARRAWQVTVLDAADRAAAGASGLPVGMLAPHVSSDDALLSRLTRAGIRATWSELERLLEAGHDWRATGVLERRPDGDTRVPPGWSAEGPNESWPATAAQLASAALPPESAAIWHARAAWVRPGALIAAWLKQPGVQLETGAQVASLQRSGDGWRLKDAAGTTLAEVDRVVVAGGIGSAALAAALPLQPVRGQLEWGRMDPADAALPVTPVNGDGHFVAHVPDADGAIWLTGATFDRDRRDPAPTAGDTEANRERLARLHPAAAAALTTTFAQGDARRWVGVRCASADRRPLVGPLDAVAMPGVWVSTAMGSRGLSFAALCAELLAAQWHGEPLPLPATLAKALHTTRR